MSETNRPFELIVPKKNKVPFILSIPHGGIAFPKELKHTYNQSLISAPDDTDWFLEILYDFAEEMGITIKKPVTGEEVEMNVDLRTIMDNFADAEYIDTVQVGDMIVRLRPLTYKEFTKNALKTFEEKRIFNIVNDDAVEDEAKLQAFTNSFVKLTELTVGMISTGIVSIQIGDDVVDNRKHIDEFIANADKQFFNEITEHLNSQKEMFAVKPMTVNSSPEDIKNGVPATYDVPITFDQSNFFA